MRCNGERICEPLPNLLVFFQAWLFQRLSTETLIFLNNADEVSVLLREVAAIEAFV